MVEWKSRKPDLASKVMNIDVEQYFAQVPPGRRERINDLHSLILALYPGAAVDFRFKMPTYSVGEGWVALANQKRYISLYTCGYHHIRRFKEKHPKVKTGKGCINLADKDDLPLEDLRKVVQHAIENPKD